MYISTNEIAKGVERISQMTEENSAAVASTAQTAHGLENLAHELEKIVLQFKL
jgi:methyl-accepting chemotaxis protein